MRFLRSSECSKTIVQLTFTTQKANTCNSWTACSVFDWEYLFWVNISVFNRKNHYADFVQKFKIASLS